VLVSGCFLAIIFLAGPQPAAPSTGVVVDATGAPVGQARVARISDPSCATETAADGTFTLACAVAGDRIAVDAPGLRQAVVLAGDRAIRVVLEPAMFSDSVVVTATRGEGRTTSAAAPVSVLTASDLAMAPPVPLDDILKVVPGFSLFRRTTSRSANPTTQGAGLRGLSASGASRALVLADGEVLNDPFGGWVYWNRVPQAAVDRVEVVRGGGSDLYGADALVGVLQVMTRRPGTPSAHVELSAAQHESGRISAFGGGTRGAWSLTGGSEAATTDGYILVSEEDRGAVDVPAGSEYASVRADLAWSRSAAFRARIGGDVFGERRENGTPIQVNSTDLRQLRLGLEGQRGETKWRLHGQAGEQTYRQAFSSIVADRSRETLTVRQRVPASQHGVTFTVETRAAGLDLLAGADTRDTAATNTEEAFFPDGRLRATTSTPGFQRTSGAFVQVTMSPVPALTVNLGARGDVRQRRRSEGFFEGDSAFSPRAVAVWAFRPDLIARGSLGWSFRAPTLNERYRGFRAGNAETLPNPDLMPETLRTVEGGVAWLPRDGALRITIFRNDLDDAVTNVTIATTPTLITRRRQNVGGVVAWGSEVEGEWRLGTRATVTGSLALTDSTFVDYPPLEGLTVPQVPDWQGSVGVRGAGPAGLALGVQARFFAEQFDDDRNTLVLGSGAVVDVSVMRALGSRVTAFANLENLFDDDYEVAATPVPSYGQPFTLHVGVRIALP
jgi:outer membrane receptor protein involved in Fe transport